MEPQSVAAQFLDVIQLLDDPLKIPDTIRVRVVEGLRIDLIDVFQPFCSHVEPLSVKDKVMLCFKC